ncbi:MAG TPA: hypothetical protein VFK33_12210 [Bacillales bacterium]|nr:hypothetical protein [Bacillales bacterium]
MKTFYHALKKSYTWMAAVLIVAFSFPFVGNTVDAASSDQGFVIHADAISGKMLPPTIVVENGQPVVQFKYESATIHGLTLTNVSQTSIGPATLKVQAPLATAKQMEVDAMSYSFGGACLKLGEGRPQLVLKDVTLVAQKQTTEAMNFQHLQVRTIPGDHGLKRPPVPGLLGGLANTGSSTLQNTIAELMKAHVPLLQCNADQNGENQGTKDNQDHPLKKTTDGAKDTVEQTKDTVHQIVGKGKDTVGQVVDKGSHTINQVIDQGGDTVDHTIDQVRKGANDILGGAGDTISNVTGEAGSTADDLTNDARNTVNDVVHGNVGDVPDDVTNTVNHALAHAKKLQKELLSDTTDLLDKIDGKNDQLSTLSGKLQDQLINPLQQTLSGSLTHHDVNDLKSIINQANDHDRLKNRLKTLNHLEAAVGDDQSHLNDLKNQYQDLKHNSQAKHLNKLDTIAHRLQQSQDKLKAIQSKINHNQSKIKNLLQDSKNALEQKNTGIFGLLGSLINNVLGGVKNLLSEVSGLLR